MTRRSRSQPPETPPKPIHDALMESLEQIRITFRPARGSFRKDRGQTALAREQTVSGFLKSYLPAGWSIKKGPIYDSHRQISMEVDCALCVPQHPPCNILHREIILAEGVHSAIEIKPNIRSLSENGEFVRALQQAASVKRLQRQINFPRNAGPRQLWPPEAHRIPYIIFAREMPSLQRAAEFMDEQKNKLTLGPWDLPDLVVGYDIGVIYHAAEASICSVSPLAKMLELQSGEGYLLFPAGTKTLFYFLALLYSFASPQPQLSDFILKDYLFPLPLPDGTGVFKVTS